MDLDPYVIICVNLKFLVVRVCLNKMTTIENLIRSMMQINSNQCDLYNNQVESSNSLFLIQDSYNSLKLL